jgi:hypothetical protein
LRRNLSICKTHFIEYIDWENIVNTDGYWNQLKNNHTCFSDAVK